MMKAALALLVSSSTGVFLRLYDVAYFMGPAMRFLLIMGLSAALVLIVLSYFQLTYGRLLPTLRPGRTQFQPAKVQI